MDQMPSDKFMIRQYTSASLFGLRKKRKTPKLGILCVDHAVSKYQSIDDFFKHPTAKESFVKPNIESIPPGEIAWLMFKPAVYIELSSGDHHTRYFDSIEARDEYIEKSGLKELIDKKFIKL